MSDDCRFQGFFPGTIAFLSALEANNDSAWFATHKPDYDRFVLGPMRRLVAGLAAVMLTIDPAFDVDPRGGAVSRIRRDTRFSRDKSPFRTRQWISFKVKTTDWTDRPAYFMGFGADGYRYGMGYYSATPGTMAALRTAIAENAGSFAAAAETAGTAGFTLAGDAYKRPRLPEGLPAAVHGWFGLKSAYLVRERTLDESFYDAALVDELAAGFTTLAPLYRFLADVALTARD